MSEHQQRPGRPLVQLALPDGTSVLIERACNARVKQKMLVRVYPNARVLVSAPKNYPDEIVREFAIEHSSWIYEHITHHRNNSKHIIAPSYLEGALHHYLGECYPLRLNVRSQAKQNVVLSNKQLIITCHHADPDTVQKQLTDWYRQRAKTVFTERVRAVKQHTPWVKNHPSLRIRFMRSRWGSCSSTGNIALNTHLIKTPIACIDHVILHELCHIAEHNHSARFYALMSKVDPDWQARKRQLEQLGKCILPY